MASSAPLLATEGKGHSKAKHTKASIFYGADEYLEELKHKYLQDFEIAALKNALPGEGDPNAGAAQSSDKMPLSRTLPNAEQAGFPFHQDHARADDLHVERANRW